MAEGAPLLREYVGKTCIEGSNPSGSASKSEPSLVEGFFLPRANDQARCRGSLGVNACADDPSAHHGLNRSKFSSAATTPSAATSPATGCRMKATIGTIRINCRSPQLYSTPALRT